MTKFEMRSEAGDQLVGRIVDAAVKLKTERDASWSDVDHFVETKLLQLSVAGYPDAVDRVVRKAVHAAVKEGAKEKA